MFTSRSTVSRVMSASARSMSTKVAVLGAAGGIGQPLSMLLKLSPAVDELSCYDVRGSPGVAADLSHVSCIDSSLINVSLFSDFFCFCFSQIPTKASVNGYLGASEGQEEELGKALTGASVVVIPAGVPRKPGMTRDDLFNVSLRVEDVVEAKLFCHLAVTQ